MRGLFKSRSSKESESLKNANKWLSFDGDFAGFETALKEKAVFYIFKHSFTCSISSVAKSRIESTVNSIDTPVYLINVIEERPMSLKIADALSVEHQSPQLIKIENAVATENCSHLLISASKLK